SSVSHFMISASGSLRSIASSRFVTATPNTLSTRRVSSLGIQASRSSAGTSAQRGSPAGLKFFVFTKCRPWCRFILNLPPPQRAAIQPSGSSKKGCVSVDGRRTSHLKRIVPAYGSCTPSVAVTFGQTRPNSSSTCLRVGRSTPRLMRLRRRYGSMRSQHHVAITGERVYHAPRRHLGEEVGRARVGEVGSRKRSRHGPVDGGDRVAVLVEHVPQRTARLGHAPALEDERGVRGAQQICGPAQHRQL